MHFMLERNVALAPLSGLREKTHFASLKVDREVLLTLKDAKFTLCVLRNARSRHVRHGSRRKFDPRIRDIQFFCQNGSSNRRNANGLTLNERKNHIEIVNH